MGLDSPRFVIQDEALLGTRIKVLGVGGGGSNAVARMMAEGMSGVEFYVLNTDVQALNASPVPNKVAIGSKLTNGLGAGADPAIGRQAALEDTERIIEILEGADMVFVTAGMGGGTGTGAAPVVASLAKELNALTVAIVTKPFEFEGVRRMRSADRGLEELTGTVDTVLTIPNDKLLQLAPKGTSFFQAFRMADDVLRQAVQGIADIITTPGLINRDFSDIKAIMLGMGHAMMGTATSKGDNAAVHAAQHAIESPLMEAGGVKGARGVLINISASSSLGLHEVNDACSLIRTATQNDDVQINFGIVMNEELGDEVKITVIATGFHRDSLPEPHHRWPDEIVHAVTAPAAAPAPAPPAPSLNFEPEPEPEPELVAEAEPEPTPAPAPAPPPADEPGPHDIELPAVLRRRPMFR